jgi:hypothetical protein
VVTGDHHGLNATLGEPLGSARCGGANGIAESQEAAKAQTHEAFGIENVFRANDPLRNRQYPQATTGQLIGESFELGSASLVERSGVAHAFDPRAFRQERLRGAFDTQARTVFGAAQYCVEPAGGFEG